MSVRVHGASSAAAVLLVTFAHTTHAHVCVHAQRSEQRAWLRPQAAVQCAPRQSAARQHAVRSLDAPRDVSTGANLHR